jgi:hypothetical protein
MKTKLLIAVIATTLSNTVLAVTLIGSRNCDDWIKERTVVDEAWLVGFLSGINVTGVTNNALNKIQSASQIHLWMDNYCKANPLHTVSKGAYQLFDELMAKK